MHKINITMAIVLDLLLCFYPMHNNAIFYMLKLLMITTIASNHEIEGMAKF